MLIMLRVVCYDAAEMAEMPHQHEMSQRDAKVARNLQIPWVPTVALVRHAHFQTTAMYLERALRRICNVITIYVDKSSILYYFGAHWVASWLTKAAIHSIVDGIIKETSVDLLLVVDPIRFDLTSSNWGFPTAFYAIDNLISFKEHLARSKIANHDYVFVAQKDTIEDYKDAGCNRVSWLPPAADPEVHRPNDTKRMYDICFVGNLWPGRKEFVEGLRSRHEDLRWYVGKQYLHNMSLIYSASNMLLNKSLCGDLNMRVFESMACGRLLITDKIGNGLDDLFTNGKELVVYSSVEEASKLVEYYSSRTQEREGIATEGMQSILREHTYDHRARQILNTTGLEINWGNRGLREPSTIG